MGGIAVSEETASTGWMFSIRLGIREIDLRKCMDRTLDDMYNQKFLTGLVLSLHIV